MKNGNAIAAIIIGLSLVVSSLIVCWGLDDVSESIRHQTFTSQSSRFPDSIVVRSGNEHFKVQLKPDQP
jgi:hypothetical protein